MAFKYTTGNKFDDATVTVENAPDKVYNAFSSEALRRAIQSITNRVLAGTSGTDGGTSFDAGLGTGGTCGIKINYGLTLAINGRMGTMAPQDNIYLPNGTQGINTYVKYLVAAKFGTRGTVYAGNEAASSTAARLPNCPDGYVAVGYMEYYSGTSGAFGRLGGGTSGAQNVLAGNVNGTSGTVNAWQNLLHMPLDES